VKRFMVQYRHGGKEWGTSFHADDIEDARAKLRSMAANGEVAGPVYSAPVPGFLPVWLVAPVLSLVCAALNGASWLKRQFGSRKP
jgi:hypothetical protein